MLGKIVDPIAEERYAVKPARATAAEIVKLPDLTCTYGPYTVMARSTILEAATSISLIALCRLVALLSLFVAAPRINAAEPFPNPLTGFQQFQFSSDSKVLTEARWNFVVMKFTTLCGTAASPDPAGCSLPRLHAELGSTGQTLLHDSLDPSHLMLNLGGLLHRIDTMSFFSRDEDTFNTVFPRHLIAARLLRELWPAIDFRAIGGGQPEDNWIVPALTARTPYSYLLDVSRSYACPGTPYSCEMKKRQLFALQSVLNAIDNDKEYASLLERIRAATAASAPERRIGRINMQILRGFSGEAGSNVLVFHGGDESRFQELSIAEYLRYVNEDARAPIYDLGEFTGSPCHDIQQGLKLFRQELGKHIDGELQCLESGDTLLTVSGAAWESMRAQGLLWRFNFFQVRALSAKLFLNLHGMEQKALQRHQIHEILEDVELVRQQMKSIPAVEYTEDDDLRREESQLYKYILAVRDQAQSLFKESQ